MAEPLNCEQVQDLLPVASLGAVSPEENDQLERHMGGCTACRQLGAHYSVMADALPGALQAEQPPERLRRNLMAQVYAESGGVTTSAAAAAAAASPAAPTASAWRRLWDRIPSSRGLTLAGGFAVTAATAIVLSIGLGGRPNAPAPTGAIAYQVTGTTAEPGVTGTLVYASGRDHGVLTVQGLPKLPAAPATATSVYEVWLIPAHGDPLPVSFLTLEPDGHTWTAVVLGDTSRYQTIAATIEPQGGTQHPTGTQVITGAIGSTTGA